MRQLLIALYQHGGRFATGPRGYVSMPEIRREYGNAAVFRAVDKGYAEVIDNTLYLTSKAIDYIWEE